MSNGARHLRVLDLDIENRPSSYWYDGQTTADITAISWSWFGESTVHIALLTADPDSRRKMLERFCAVYQLADICSAHNIRRHDLPIIQAHLAELQMPLLEKKLAHDTLKDLKPKWKDISRSQENLCEMLGIAAEKHHMSQTNWREANRLTPAGLRKTRLRVRKDVVQHKVLRERLLELGWLGPPRMWSP